MQENFKVMVVDDEPIMREALASQIPWDQYQITLVKSAAHAIEAMDYLAEHDADLILVDIKMPVINGIDLIKLIREKNTTIEIVVISGFAEFSYVQQTLRLGVRDYLLKPFDEATLLSVVLAAKEAWQQKKMLSDLQENSAQAQQHAARTGKPYSATVMQVLRIIDEEIANKDLSLKWISAERMFLNENYLCKRFQEEVKQRFSAYLLEHRMILAMRLMTRDADMQIQTVARETGFGDNAQYFSISFKKYTGYTPTEFRSHIRQSV